MEPTASSTYISLLAAQIISVCKSVSDYFVTKGFGSSLLIVTSTLVGAQNYQLLLMLGILVFVDMVMGMMASYKLGHAITSRRALKTTTKSIVYLLFFVAAHQASQIVPFSEVVISRGILSFLAITELLSVIESVARMGYAIPQKLLNQIKNFETGGDAGNSNTSRG